ncbi:hypothetical protein BCR44DRAFT_1498564 [Catenaria anguillulae PL171]|uniref:B30.2/SPRY domain-containing protein n=1 Tax=Catenaria anguillulae PL171 TaxID=765915 RepID=A0A1Y2HQB8_9FUNG|nr:hypothetical protein BCR44DRAFT_1498564 [Catenaria anguillulae PL171]
MSHQPSSPDDCTLAPSSSLALRGVQGDPSIKISDRTVQFNGPRIRNIQSNVAIPTANCFVLPPLPTYSQANRVPGAHSPSRQSTWYFECTILDQPRGPASLVCVGLATDELPGYLLGPGMEMSGHKNIGVGYHSTGRKYVNGEYEAEYGHAFGAGDTVGVGWDTAVDRVFFTVNGKMLGTAAAECLSPATPMFPTFGGTRGAVLCANFGTEAFMWEQANQDNLGFFMDPLPKYSATDCSDCQDLCALESTLANLALDQVSEMDLVDMTTVAEVPLYGGWSNPPAY